jgi:eukaryotic-like serine/threonine-protein kinase
LRQGTLDPVLLDFGAAKDLLSDQHLTAAGTILGTPSHMAPEQAMGHVDEISAQTDIYALWVTLYEMLTGTCLFEHPTQVGLMVLHVTATVKPMREHVPELPERVTRLVESCLAKRPADRPR